MSVNTETNPAQGQTAVMNKESVYASLFEKINLSPASSLGDINVFLDDAALSEATAGERLTAAMQVLWTAFVNPVSRWRNSIKRLLTTTSRSWISV